MGTGERVNGGTGERVNGGNGERVRLALRMIALTRLYLHDVNIVAATALEALDPAAGRERGLDAGANVVMPNLTESSARQNYNLYPGKATAT